MSLSMELELQEFPKNISLKDGTDAMLRPLNPDDEEQLHGLFLEIPEPERMFIKHRVQDVQVIHDWCRNLDYGRNLPLVALLDDKITGVATLHQQLGGWKRHIGRVSVLVHPRWRGRGLARAIVTEILEIARQAGLEKVEAEFIGEQEAAARMFALLGFRRLLRLDDYVKDMQAISHDYILMGLELKTDEDYTSASG